MNLDYNVFSDNATARQFIQERAAVNQELIDLLHKCTTYCNLCSHELTFSLVGMSIAKTLTGLCQNPRCNNAKVTDTGMIGDFYKINLAVVLQSLIYDSGYMGYSRWCHSALFPNLSKWRYYRHTEFIYKLMEDFYSTNINLIHDDIKQFYQNIFFVSPID